MPNYTDEQQRVIDHRDGHARVIACPGSGKSFSLAGRVDSLIASGTPSNRIVSMMFNSDARDSFDAKLKKSLGSRAPKTFTFHGMGTELIKYLESKGLIDKKALVVQEKTKLDMIKKLLPKYIGRDSKINLYVAAKEFDRFVDVCKSQLDHPSNVFDEYEFSPTYRVFIDAFKMFEKVRERAQIRFFSDLIWEPVLFFLDEKNASHLAEFQEKRPLDHILVDEYQDINPIQQSLVKIVAGSTGQIMAVGDDDQTIYQFAGAKPEFLIDTFMADYPEAKTYHLTRTFRYGPQVSMLASHIIANNNNRIEKMCVSADGTPETLVILDKEPTIVIDKLDPTKTDKLQASQSKQDTLIHYLDQWKQLGRQLSDVAVLVRSFYQSVSIQLSLLNKGIPFRLEGGKSVFSYHLIQSIIAALHIANRSFDSLSVRDQGSLAFSILTWPTTYLSYDDSKPLKDKIFAEPANFSSIVTKFVSDNPNLMGTSRDRLMIKAQAWKDFSHMGTNPIDVIEKAYKQLDIERLLSAGNTEQEELEEQENILANFTAFVSQQGNDLSTVLSRLDVMRALELPKSNDIDCITITSLHRSKGLEWPMVIIPGLSHGKIPLIPRSKSQTCDMEEERRLFFVGVTRAINVLLLICPDDEDLRMWLEAGRKGSPEFAKADENAASSFLYESNIFNSQNAEELIKGTTEALRSPMENKDIINAYLGHIGASHRAV